MKAQASLHIYQISSFCPLGLLSTLFHRVPGLHAELAVMNPSRRKEEGTRVRSGKSFPRYPSHSLALTVSFNQRSLPFSRGLALQSHPSRFRQFLLFLVPWILRSNKATVSSIRFPGDFSWFLCI